MQMHINVHSEPKSFQQRPHELCFQFERRAVRASEDLQRARCCDTFSVINQSETESTESARSLSHTHTQTRQIQRAVRA